MNRKVDNLLAVLGVLVLSLVLFGCTTSPKGPYTAAANGALTNPDSDYINARTQQTALQYSKAHVPENLSQLPADGMVFWDQREVVKLNPDGSVYEYTDAKGNVCHLYDRNEKLFKWNNVMDAVGGNFSRFWFSVGGFLGARQNSPVDVDLQKRYTGLTDGITVEITDLSGNLVNNDKVITAGGDAKAKVQKVITDGLGVALDKHWAGATGYLKVRNDGLVEIITATATGLTTITGELVKLSPYGLANSLGQKAVEAIIKPVTADGTISRNEVAVELTPPPAVTP
jgi:hypothetical protein